MRLPRPSAQEGTPASAKRPCTGRYPGRMRHPQAVVCGSRYSAGASGGARSRQLPWLLPVWPVSEPPAPGLLPRQPPPQRARPRLPLGTYSGGASSAGVSSPWPAPALSVCGLILLPPWGSRNGRPGHGTSPVAGAPPSLVRFGPGVPLSQRRDVRLMFLSAVNSSLGGTFLVPGQAA